MEDIKYLGLSTSSCSSKIYAYLNPTWNSYWGHLFDLTSCALQVDVSLVHSHLPVIPSLGSLTAGSSSTTDAEMLVRKSDWPWNFDILSFSVAYELIGDLLNCVESIATEGDSGSFDFLVLHSLLLGVFVSHVFVILSNNKWLI